MTQAPFEDAHARAMAQVCLDLHEALGVRWGDNPYETIAGLRTERDAYRDQCELLGERNEELRKQRDILAKDHGIQLECGGCGSKNAWSAWMTAPKVPETLAEATAPTWMRKQTEHSHKTERGTGIAKVHGLEPRRSPVVIACDSGEED